MTESGVETAATVTAKVAPPVGVSLATVAGYQVSELVLWATLVYTILMIGHKVYQIYLDVSGNVSKTLDRE
jgi:hypothetical protein